MKKSLLGSVVTLVLALALSQSALAGGGGTGGFSGGGGSSHGGTIDGGHAFDGDDVGTGPFIEDHLTFGYGKDLTKSKSAAHLRQLKTQSGSEISGNLVVDFDCVAGFQLKTQLTGLFPGSAYEIYWGVPKVTEIRQDGFSIEVPNRYRINVDLVGRINGTEQLRITGTLKGEQLIPAQTDFASFRFQNYLVSSVDTFADVLNLIGNVKARQQFREVTDEQVKLFCDSEAKKEKKN